MFGKVAFRIFLPIPFFSIFGSFQIYFLRLREQKEASPTPPPLPPRPRPRERLDLLRGKLGSKFWMKMSRRREKFPSHKKAVLVLKADVSFYQLEESFGGLCWWLLVAESASVLATNCHKNISYSLLCHRQMLLINTQAWIRSSKPSSTS